MQTKTARFILIWALIAFIPALGRGQTEAVTLARLGNTLEVSIGGQPFTTYYFDSATAKAYLQPLRSAHGVIVTREFPVGDAVPAGHEHDRSLEPHQRPLYFGHGDIAGYDFWGEEVFAKYYGHHETEHAHWGRMAVRKVDEMRAGSKSGEIRASFDLMGDGKPLGEETQQYIFRIWSHELSTASSSSGPTTARSRSVTPRKARLPFESLPNSMPPTATW